MPARSPHGRADDANAAASATLCSFGGLRGCSGRRCCGRLALVAGRVAACNGEVHQNPWHARVAPGIEVNPGLAKPGCGKLRHDNLTLACEACLPAGVPEDGAAQIVQLVAGTPNHAANRMQAERVARFAATPPVNGTGMGRPVLTRPGLHKGKAEAPMQGRHELCADERLAPRPGVGCQEEAALLAAGVHQLLADGPVCKARRADVSQDGSPTALPVPQWRG